MDRNRSRCQEIAYLPDSAGLFSNVRQQPWAVFLDSGGCHSAGGRYDLLSANPRITLATRGGVTEIKDGQTVHRSLEDPFLLLQRTLGPRIPSPNDLPFCGGAIGWFGYDLARRLERLPDLHTPVDPLPDMAVGIYDWALVVDHRLERSWLLASGPGAHEERWERLVKRFADHNPPSASDKGFRVLGGLRTNMSHADYVSALTRIKRYIRDGDCYQVNFAQGFSVPAEGDPWALYLALRRINPAPFCAFIDSPYGQVLSSSPERFLQVRGNCVETQPIKGTRPRSFDPERDRSLAEALSGSAKDRAENLMIVDLLRNDLGKSCVPGSIEVPRLFEVQSFARVHHLVSTIRGRLARGQSALTLLRGCFPGGSITGAPKLRAMEIIEELEPERRGVYCGAIGYIGFDGAMDTSIAIRTLVHAHREVRFWVGGGVVADSLIDAEYQETLDKAAPLIELLGNGEFTDTDPDPHTAAPQSKS